MLTREENERLCRVGPGTPMGAVMRRYWLPALLAWELPEPDCPPVRVRLLGENLVAFRATDGSIGLLDESCPHRGASLWLGRNEENGLRCVYHGWKFDAAGQCTEQMNEPAPFSARIRAPSYPTVEMGGIVWAYMGPPDKQPAPPEFGLTRATGAERVVTKVIQESNWLQALEGGIDSSHFTILHRALKPDALQEGINPNSLAVRAGPPAVDVEIMDYGYRYFASRVDAEAIHARCYHYVMPFTQLRPPGYGLKQVHGHFWVPMDDETTMVWNWYYSYQGDLPDEHKAVAGGGGNAYGSHVDAATFRPMRNKSNDWMIDRAMQKTETFTGISGINQQDRAVQESMGAIVDRSKEHLGPADKAIVTTRRLLREAMETVAGNADPRGVAPPSYAALWPVERSFKPGEDWREGLLAMMRAGPH